MDDDITETLAPKSDQLDNIDLAGGPRIFTVKSVDVHKDSEQPVVVHLVEFDRPWKPSKQMRNVLGWPGCWGVKSSTWAGKRVELFRDPSVTFGKETPGGTRIRALSNIDGPQEVPIMLSRGRMGTYHVDPLPDESSGPTADDIAACADVATLRSWWQQSTPALRKSIEARVAELSAPSEGSAQPDDDHEADLVMLAAEAEAERDE